MWRRRRRNRSAAPDPSGQANETPPEPASPPPLPPELLAAVAPSAVTDRAPDDDPLAQLARVHALRQMADLGGIPHDPAWDRLEAAALAALGRPVPPAGTDATITEPQIDDPFLTLAQLRASRQVAEEAGWGHNPDWDRAEDAARRRLGAVGPPPDPPARPSR